MPNPEIQGVPDALETAAAEVSGGEQASRQSASSRTGRLEVWRRLVVSVGAGAASLLAFSIPVPGLTERGREMAAIVGMRRADSLTMGALGLSPIVSAFVAVELAALIVPAWRRLRVGSPGERRRLAVASWILAAVFAPLQAFFVAGVAEAGHLSDSPYALVALLPAAVLAYGALALLVDTFGLGNGIAVLLVAEGLRRLYLGGQIWITYDSTTDRLLPMVVLLGAFAWLCARLLSGRWGKERSKDQLPVPTCGVMPAQWASVLLAVVVGASEIFPSLNAPAERMKPEGDLRVVAVLGLLLVLVPLCAFLFNRPAAVESARARAGIPMERREVLRQLRRATLASGLLLLLVAGLPWACTALGLPLTMSGVPLLLLVAMAMDLKEEWRARAHLGPLVPVWPLHQLYAVGPLLEVLSRAGIEAHARSLRARSLYQFFGPYMPVQLLVAPESAERAQGLLRERLLEDASAVRPSVQLTAAGESSAPSVPDALSP